MENIQIVATVPLLCNAGPSGADALDTAQLEFTVLQLLMLRHEVFDDDIQDHGIEQRFS